MDRLKEKCILIGRDPVKSNLLIAVNVNGKIYIGNVGPSGCVPDSVSRCKPAEQMGHCKIDTDASGTMRLTNMKPQNVTYVDNVQIMSKRVHKHSNVALGKDKFVLDVNDVLKATLKIMDKVLPPPPETVDISHLEQVFKEYEDTLEDIQRRQIIKNKMRMIPIMLGSASGLVAFLFGSSVMVSGVIALIIVSLYLLIFLQKDTSIEERNAAKKRLEKNCVCPKCKSYLSSPSFLVLKQHGQCPYCKVHWKKND